MRTSGGPQREKLLRLLDGHRRVLSARLTHPARWRGSLLEGTEPARSYVATFDGAMTDAARGVPLGRERLIELWRAIVTEDPSEQEMDLMEQALARARAREPVINAALLHLHVASIAPYSAERERVARLAAGYVLAADGWWSTLFTAVEQHFMLDLDGYRTALDGARSDGNEDAWLDHVLRAMIDRSALATWCRERSYIPRRYLRTWRRREPKAAALLDQQLVRLEAEEADEPRARHPRTREEQVQGVWPTMVTHSSPAGEPVASVVVPAWCASETISRCLWGLETQDADFPFEVIVVSSGTDPTTDIARRFPNVRVLWSEARMYPGSARNAGLKAARGRFVCFLAADCVPHPDWLRRRVECHRRGYELVGGFIGSWGRPTIAGWAHYLARFWGLLPHRDHAGGGGPLFHLSYERAALERAGGFPNALAGEDTILNQRLVDQGSRAYFDPAIRIDHIDPRSFAAALEQQRAQGYAVGDLVAQRALPQIYAARRIGTSLRATRQAVVSVARHAPRQLVRTIVGLPLLFVLIDERRRAIARGQANGVEAATPTRQVPVELAPRPRTVAVSAVVAAYNEERLIGRCIESLLAQDLEELEIIVVDDGSTDSTASIAESRGVTVIRQRHRGPARARNVGAATAIGKVLVFIDADLEMEVACLRRLTLPILEGRTVGTFTKELWVANPHKRWAKCWTLNRGFPQGHVFPPGFPDEWSNFRAVDREAFLRAGGFDDVGYGEDLTLAPKLGCKAIAVQGAVMWHHNPDSLREVWENAVWIGRGTRVRELPRIWWRFSPVRSLARGASVARRSGRPSFLPFALVYDAGVLLGYAASRVKPARHWK